MLRMGGDCGSQTRVCRLRDRKENSFRQAELYGIDEGIEQLYAQITRINQMKRGRKFMAEDGVDVQYVFIWKMHAVIF